jgi:hypothetical protein
MWNVKTLLKLGFNKRLSSLEINRIKGQTDTLFVLGSGASINNISKKGWEIIENNNSVGLNYWPIHDFIPTFLMFEMPRGERGNFFYDVLWKKKSLYANTPIIFKGLYKNRKDFNGIEKVKTLFHPDLIDNIYLSYELSIPGRNENEFKLGLNHLDLTGFFSTGKQIQSLGQYRGTVTCALIFGIKAGYKNIVLCGVDLNDTKYFYEDLAKYYQDKGIAVPPTGQTETIHKTNIALHNVLPVSKVIILLQDFFSEKHSGKIYVSNKKSALFPELEFYNLSDED